MNDEVRKEGRDESDLRYLTGRRRGASGTRE